MYTARCRCADRQTNTHRQLVENFRNTSHLYRDEVKITEITQAQWNNFVRRRLLRRRKIACSWGDVTNPTRHNGSDQGCNDSHAICIGQRTFCVETPIDLWVYSLSLTTASKKTWIFYLPLTWGPISCFSVGLRSFGLLQLTPGNHHFTTQAALEFAVEILNSAGSVAITDVYVITDMQNLCKTRNRYGFRK